MEKSSLKSRNKRELRCGVTTGASAAAAARAAALLLFRKEKHTMVTVINPQGTSINVPVKRSEFFDGGAMAVVVKDGGDDPDVTDGLEIIVTVRPMLGFINIKGGEGVGTVTLPGLPISVGNPAINPIPLKMIKEAVQPLLPLETGLDITISVPGGEEVAKRTLNGRLGITGGISILGTSGIVRPMSEESLKDSLVPFVMKAAANGIKQLVLTPGGIGYRQAVEVYRFHPDIVIEMSNYVGFMLEQCVNNMIAGVILWGHIGKMTKVSGGIFNTHSRVADGRREILAAYAALNGAKKELVSTILNTNTLEGVVKILEKSQMHSVFDQIAAKASQRADEYVWGKLRVGTVITDGGGRILGKDNAAEELGRLMGCVKLR